jgi:hypothetical protein
VLALLPALVPVYFAGNKQTHANNDWLGTGDIDCGRLEEGRRLEHILGSRNNRLYKRCPGDRLRRRVFVLFVDLLGDVMAAWLQDSVSSHFNCLTAWLRQY